MKLPSLLLIIILFLFASSVLSFSDRGGEAGVSRDTSPRAFFVELSDALYEKGGAFALHLAAGRDRFLHNAAFLGLLVEHRFFTPSSPSFSHPGFASYQPSAAFASGFSSAVNFRIPSCDREALQSLTSSVAAVAPLTASMPLLTVHPEKRWPIASLTKLMTSVIVVETMDLNREIIMSETAVAAEGRAGLFSPGEVFTVYDLLRAMLVMSSNDAAVALAEAYGETALIDTMQRKASQLHMIDTTYLEPTGLSFINQSTASDLHKLVVYIYHQHPELFAISREKEVFITELRSGKERRLPNINEFAGEQHYVGGKTGYIEEARRNLVALFSYDRDILITTTLGADNAFDDTRALLAACGLR